MDPQWLQNLTCEQRRAIEYGIDVPEQTIIEDYSKDDDGAKRAALSASFLRQQAAADAAPDPLAYCDPVAFGCAYDEWRQRNPEPKVTEVIPGFRVHEVTDAELEQTRAAFDGPGEGDNR